MLKQTETANGCHPYVGLTEVCQIMQIVRGPSPKLDTNKQFSDMFRQFVDLR